MFRLNFNVLIQTFVPTLKIAVLLLISTRKKQLSKEILIGYISVYSKIHRVPQCVKYFHLYIEYLLFPYLR